VNWDQSRSFDSIPGRQLAPEKGTVLVDALLAQLRLNRPRPLWSRSVAGTGLATRLSGLKRYKQQHTAGFVTVAA